MADLLAYIIAVPIMLFPIALIWYLNTGGVIYRSQGARARRAVREREISLFKSLKLSLKLSQTVNMRTGRKQNLKTHQGFSFFFRVEIRWSRVMAVNVRVCMVPLALNRMASLATASLLGASTILTKSYWPSSAYCAISSHP